MWKGKGWNSLMSWEIALREKSELEGLLERRMRERKKPMMKVEKWARARSRRVCAQITEPGFTLDVLGNQWRCCSGISLFRYVLPPSSTTLYSSRSATWIRTGKGLIFSPTHSIQDPLQNKSTQLLKQDHFQQISSSVNLGVGLCMWVRLLTLNGHW